MTRFSKNIARIFSFAMTLMISLQVASIARAETCEETAQRAYDRALVECRSGQQCRSDRDCELGEICELGQCVPRNPVNCVPNCVERRMDGTCRTYDADFCGRNPHCAVNCQERRMDGTCRTYGADRCVDGPYECVLYCADRRFDGTCRTYGPDFCGPYASCSPNCVDRRPDGTCREYGADICN